MLSARWSSIIYPHPTRSFFSNSFSIHFSRSYFTQSFSESGLLFAIGCSHQWSRLSCCCICVLLSPSHSFYDLHTNCSHQVVVVVSLFSSGLHTASMIFAPTVHIWTESERRKEKQTNNIQKEYFVIKEERIICIVSIFWGVWWALCFYFGSYTRCRQFSAHISLVTNPAI